MATVQAALYTVADDVLLMRAGLISIVLFGCNVTVRLSSPKRAGSRAHEHHASGAIDVLHDAAADDVEHEALNLAVLVVINAWSESFEAIPLIKSELCSSEDGEDVFRPIVLLSGCHKNSGGEIGTSTRVLRDTSNCHLLWRHIFENLKHFILHDIGQRKKDNSAKSGKLVPT